MTRALLCVSLVMSGTGVYVLLIIALVLIVNAAIPVAIERPRRSSATPTGGRRAAPPAAGPDMCPAGRTFDRCPAGQHASQEPHLPSTPAEADQPSAAAQVPPPALTVDEPCQVEQIRERFNFAAAEAGASVLASAPGIKGADRILQTDSDKYMSSSCSLPSKWLVLQLSEDIEVSVISTTSREHYAAGVEHFQVLGSDRFPTPQWVLLGYGTRDALMPCLAADGVCMVQELPGGQHHGRAELLRS